MIKPSGSDKIDNIDNWICNLLNVQCTFTQTSLMDDTVKWCEGMARMFRFDLVIHQLQQPYIFSCQITSSIGSYTYHFIQLQPSSCNIVFNSMKQVLTSCGVF